MKSTTRIYGYLVAAILALFATSCGEEPAGNQSDNKSLEVSITSKELDAKKGSFVINVDSNTEWTISTSAEWITLSGSEFVGAAGVLVTYTANEDSKSRSTKLNVGYKGDTTPTYSILVSQKGTSSNTGDNSGNDNGEDNNGDNGSGNEDNGGDNNNGDNNDNSGDNGNDNGDDTGDDDDDSGNTGGGGGIVTNSGAKHAGWAELPAEEDNDDYYYAYHMIPDKGNGKVRNFAVCYSADLGCPVWVASPMHSYYTAKNTSRSDAYGPDPDIPSSIQVHKRSGYTRGHMLGSSDRLVSRGANVQAFYYSNIAPQLQDGFNTGGGVWNNLEEHCDGLLCADTLYMVNGCYWENKKTTSSGTVIPTHYYKVLLRTKKGNTGKWVVNCSESELQCVVFMVKHNSSQHKVEPHTGMLMSVAELERMTGHTFFPNVPNAPKDTYKASDWGL